MTKNIFWVVVLSFCFTVILINFFGVKQSPNIPAPDVVVDSTYLSKKIAMYNVLARYNSPLVHEVDSFLNACLTYRIDCYLLPSISGVESTFGQQYLVGTYNVFGWGGGYIAFQSWEDSFLQIAKGLRFNYINRNLTSIEEIAHVYAPPSTTWSRNVQFFLSRFYQQEMQIIQPIFNL
ncbi:MAG: hypothetical protein WC775_01850 [Patescibacteria group bacterium]|jgi:hypothetical protein